MEQTLKQTLIDLGWKPYGANSLESPQYVNAAKFIADVYKEDEIYIYINRSKIAQNGTFVCKISDKNQLELFVRLMDNL